MEDDLLFGSSEGESMGGEQDAISKLAASLKMELSGGGGGGGGGTAASSSAQAPSSSMSGGGGGGGGMPPSSAAAAAAPAVGTPYQPLNYPHHPGAAAAHAHPAGGAAAGMPHGHAHHSHAHHLGAAATGMARAVAGTHAIGSGLSLGGAVAPPGTAPSAATTGVPQTGSVMGTSNNATTPTSAAPSFAPGLVKTEPSSTPTTSVPPAGAPATTPTPSAGGAPKITPQALVQLLYHRYRKGEVTLDQLRTTLNANNFNPKMIEELLTRFAQAKVPRPPVPGQPPGAQTPSGQHPKPGGIPGQPTTPGSTPTMARPGVTAGMVSPGGVPGQIPSARPGQPATPTPNSLSAPGGTPQAGEGVSVTPLRQGGNIFGNPQLPNFKITPNEEAQKYAYAKTPGATVSGASPATATASTPQPPAKRPRTAPPSSSGQPATPLSATGPSTAASGTATGAPKKPAAAKKGGDLDDKQPNFQVKDLTDVTRLAGVNLKEESNLFLPTYGAGAGEERQHAPEEVQSPFINKAALQRRATEIAAKYGLKPSEEIYEYIALATQHRLTDVVEKLATISKQRLDIYKDEMQIEITSDPRKQLKLIEKREKEDKERRDAEEKERALKEKKPDADKKKTDQARLEEEEKIRTRTANMTALQAIGDVRPRRPAPTAGAPATAATPAAGRGAGPAAAGVRPQLPVFTKAMLDQLTALQKLKAQQTLTPQQAKQLANLQVQLHRFKNLAAQLAGRKATLDPKTGRITVSEGPRTRFDTRVITMKDLEFYILHKDPHTKYSRIVWRLEKKKRSASLAAAAGQSSSST